VFYKQSEWETLKMWYPVAIPDANAKPADPSEAAAFLAISVNSKPGPASTSAAVVIKPADAADIGQSYLIVPGRDGRPQRIMGQGLMVAKANELIVGANPASQARAAVLMENWQAGKRQYYPAAASNAAALKPGIVNELKPVPSTWQPGLRVVPLVMQNGQFSQVRGFQLDFCDCAGRTKRIEVAYCPAGGQCQLQPPVTLTGKHTKVNIWLDPKEKAAAHGYFYLRSLDTNEETVSWYQLGGGVGPATAEIHAPLLDSQVGAEVADEKYPLDNDSNVLYAPTDLCSASLGAAPELPLLGPPVRVEPVVANADGGLRWGLKDQSPLTVRLGYSQDLLDRLGVDETTLVVLYFDQQLQQWTPIQTVGQSLELDWIAAAPQDFAGNGGIYALAYKP
ncbi:MAG TPA: hypothetical protein VD886_20490, partial [Herpetosiphonaceae bacterium]|nr:hypothetical protein [Herpetosiphonaceae bacterium]